LLLIHWITELQDKQVLREFIAFKKAKESESQPLAISDSERHALEEALDDIAGGRVFTHHNLDAFLE